MHSARFFGFLPSTNEAPKSERDAARVPRLSLLHDRNRDQVTGF